MNRLTNFDPICLTTWIASLCAGLVIIAAAVLGFTALYDLFGSIGLFASWLGIFFPLLFDLAEVTAAVSVFNAKLQGEDDKFAWRMVLLFTGLGVTANILHASHAAYTGRIDSAQLVLAIFATSLFPLSVALVTHLLKSVIDRAIRRNQAAVTLADLDNQLDAGRKELNNLLAQIEQAKVLNNGVNTPKFNTLINARKEAKEGRQADLLSYLDANPQATLTDAAKEVGVSRQTVGNYVNELEQSGDLHRNGNGWQVTK